jgi:hypothetical protein
MLVSSSNTSIFIRVYLSLCIIVKVLLLLIYVLRGAFVDLLDVKSGEMDFVVVFVIIPSMRGPQRALAGNGEGAGT